MNKNNPNKTDLSKNELNRILQKVYFFNKKRLSDMILLEDRYLELYEKIIKHYSELSQYDDVVIFKNYFSNLDKIKQLVNSKEEFKRNPNIVNRYNDSFPDFLIKKFFHENDELYSFKENHEKLKTTNCKNQSTHKNYLNKINQDNIEIKVKRKSYDLNKFYKDLRNLKMLSYTQTEKIISEWKPLYEYILKNKSFSDSLIKESFHDINELNRFKDDYKELKITNCQNPVTREIRVRMYVDKLKRTQPRQFNWIDKNSKKNAKHPNYSLDETKPVFSENYEKEVYCPKISYEFEKIKDEDKDYIFKGYEKVKNKLSEEDFIKEFYRIKKEYNVSPFTIAVHFVVDIIVNEYENKKMPAVRKDVTKISKEGYELIRKNKLTKRYEKFKNELSEDEFLNEFDKFENHKEDLNNFFKDINNDYISYSTRINLIDNFKNLYNWASKIFYYPNFKSYNTDKFKPLVRFIEYYEDLKEYSNNLNDKINVNQIKRVNDSFIDTEVKDNENFFEDIQDENKKRAIVCDEDNIKIVAGAGAGKTFIIQKKIDYLINIKGKDPKKILCLCYTGKGANDLKKKINNDAVDIFTFHGFCREVSKNCGKNLPTDDKLLDDVINNYIRKVIDDDEKLNEILEYFNYYVKNPSIREFDSFEEYKEFKRGNRIKTLRNKYDFYNGYQKQSYKGEVVRSLEELIIANFLFMHNIDYIYEDTYEHECLTPIISNFFGSNNYFCLNRDLNTDLVNRDKFQKFEKSLGSYQPDFYLPDKNIYIEHFGVARDNIAHWLKGDAQKKYTEDMNFKLKLHKFYNTNLITTFSYYMSEGVLLDKLREFLSNYYELRERDKKEIFAIIINNNRSEDFKQFKLLIKSFINIFEAKNLPKSKFNEFKKENLSQKNIYLKRKHELFLNIVSEIYEDYDLWNKKGGLYYNREVTNALNFIENGEYNECYDYIFIDEYQDINYVRCKLLQELQKINNSKLFVVGDDWQSIYGFNGSEVKLFVDFNEYFPNSETIKISENRRNCQALIDISSSFIRQNKNQEYKELEYYENEKSVNSNPIKLVPYDKNRNKILYVEKVVQEIIRSNRKKDLEILLLGRNNKDINFLINNRLFKQVYGDKKYKEIEYSKNSDISIYFMSIHQSKGLEKDAVIILNFNNYDYGFPNQIDDDSVLQFIKEKEDYLFAEERRLLYVALTRTRNNVYLIYPNSNYSEFIKELKEDYGLKDSEYKIYSNKLMELYEFNHFYCGDDYKNWYPNSIPIPIEEIDYYFKIKDEGYLNAIDLELFIWYENFLNYDDPLENAFKKLVGFDEGTKLNLRDKSLELKKEIINSDIWVLVNNKKCNFTISGIGEKSVKFTKTIIFENENIKKEYAEDILRRYDISTKYLEKLLNI